MNKSNNFTQQQEAIIRSYYERWLNFSTEPINRHKAEEAVKAAYRLINSPEPKILFFDSPLKMVEAIVEWTGKDTLYEIQKFVRHQYQEKIRNALLNSRDEMIAIDNEMSSIVNSKDDEIRQLIDLDNVDISYYHEYTERSEYRKDEIDIHIESSLSEKLEYVYSAIRYKLDCDRIYYGVDTCFICDRPTKLLFTEDDCLFADDGEKVIEYSDGFFAYSMYDDSDLMLEIKNSKYQKITEKQQSQIKVYFDKWSNIVLSKQPIDKELAANSIREVYHFLQLPIPEIIYFSNSLEACKQIEQWKTEQVEFKTNPEIRQLFTCFTTEVESEIIEQYGLDFYSEELCELWSDKYQYIYDDIRESIDNRLLPTKFSRWHDIESKYSLFNELDADFTIPIDYAFSVLNVPGVERKEWQLYQALVKNCGWIIFGLDKVLFCDRTVGLT